MGSANQSTLCTPAEYWRRAEALSADRRYRSITYLYRYFSTDRRLLYVGVSGTPWLRHSNHNRKIWSPYATLVRYERFPDRQLALIAESSAIVNEMPDYSLPVNLQVEHWPERLSWYRAKTGGEFRGEDPVWFALDDRRRMSPTEAPHWWCEPFRQEMMKLEDSLKYKRAMASLGIA